MTAHQPDTLLLIQRALGALPLAADEPETRLRFGRVIHSVSCGTAAGFVVWDNWAQNSAKYDPDVSGKTWASFDVSVRDIFDAADADNPDWRYPDIAPSIDLPPPTWVERFVTERLNMRSGDVSPQWVHDLVDDRLNVARGAAKR